MTLHEFKQAQFVAWRMKSAKLGKGQQIRLSPDKISYHALRDNDGKCYIVRMKDEIDKGLQRFSEKLPEFDILRADGSLIGKAQELNSL